MSREPSPERSKKALLLIVFAPFFCFGAIALWVLPNSETNIDSMRCAESAARLKVLVSRFMERADRFPDGPGARAAFVEMASTLEPGQATVWARTTGCPESVRQTDSIGYIYVAGGLDTRVARARGALIFFCPAGSHRRGREHAHALRGDGQLCAPDNNAMIRILEAAMEDGLTGQVGYSDGAVELIRRQLAARRAPIGP